MPDKPRDDTEKMMKDEVSVIIPCYNEEENIIECISRIPDGFEIVVVDDGSTDKTAESARPMNARVIRYEENMGKGYAVMRGIDEATGDIIVIQDADMATPPEELPDMVEPILNGKADFVNGTRFVHQMEDGAMSNMNMFGNRIFALMVSVIIRQRLTDTLCGHKAFRKSLAGLLCEESWPDFDLLIKAKRKGMRITEVPIHYKRRTAGMSKMKASDAFGMLLAIKRSMLWQYRYCRFAIMCGCFDKDTESCKRIWSNGYCGRYRELRGSG